MGSRIDITGQKFGKLTVIAYQRLEHGSSKWLCKCECGKHKVIRSYDLRSGRTTSCGCNLRLVKQGKDNEAKNEQIRELRAKGLKGKEVAELVGMTAGGLAAHITRQAYKGVYL